LDFPYDFINCTAAPYGLHNSPILGSISTPLTVNSANIPVRKAPKYANSLKIQHFGTFSTHHDREFLITCPDFLSTGGHPAPASFGLALNCPIRPRISRKSSLGTATSAIWNTTYRECLTTLAPILISFSRKVVSDQCSTLGGNLEMTKNA